MNLINTNARSLRPKIASFIQCFVNLTLTLAIVTETWYAAGTGLEDRNVGLLLGNGVRSFTLNRDPLPSGVAYGGVAIFLRDSITKASAFEFPNPEKYEVLPLGVVIADIKRKLFVVGAYIPPGYNVPRGKACLQHIGDLVLTIKNKHVDPLILVAGDFNQWDIGSTLAEFSDMAEVSTPATREGRLTRCSLTGLTTLRKVAASLLCILTGLTARSGRATIVFNTSCRDCRGGTR